MLWLTWALVGFFDVRFITDSIFGENLGNITILIDDRGH
jgi:hypothetical protein